MSRPCSQPCTAERTARRPAAGILLIGLVAFGAALAALAARALSAEKPPDLSAEAQKVVHPEEHAEVEKLVRRDPYALLQKSLQWYEQRVTGYTCRFYKQELVGDKLLKPETMFMKFREKPFSLYLKWIEDPNKGREVIYFEGKYKNQAVVHPDGLVGIIFRKVSIDPEGSTALRHSRRPVTNAGMANMLRFIIPQCDEARRRGDLKLEYLGLRTEAGRPAYLIRRTLPDGKGYACYQLFIYIDRQFLLPVRTEAYDWKGRLMSDYRYTDLKLNPALTDDDFDPDNREYGYRLL